MNLHRARCRLLHLLPVWCVSQAFTSLALGVPPRDEQPIYFDQPAGREVEYDAETAEALYWQFMKRHTAAQYPEAAELALRLEEMLPENPHVQYNLACVMARLHRTDQACAALKRAVEHGWRNLAHTRIDPDLHSIRASDCFAAVLGLLHDRREQERIVPRPLREESWERIVEELQQRTPELLQTHRVPGMAVALVRDGELVWSGGFGRNADEEAMTEGHLFRLESPMHLLSVRGALQAEDEGGADLDDMLAYLRGDAPHNADDNAPVAQHAALKVRSRNHRSLRRQRITGEQAVALFQLTVEMHREQSFPAYCRSVFREQWNLQNTSVLARTDAEDPLAVGHSVLGTAMPAPSLRESRRHGQLQTTAHDMGLLLEQLMARPDSADAAARRDMHQRVVEFVDDYGGELSLAVQAAATRDGMRLQMTDNAGGTGALFRWYPQSHCGIVVLYNASHGRDAARRVAHLALGGH